MRASTLLTIAALFTLAGARPASAQSGEQLFQRALVLERSNGQVREAIPIYERIVKEFASDRALAARALVQLGLAHEALGHLEAREAYQRVLSDFGDQAAMVAQARARLSALADDAPEPVADQASRLLLSDGDGCSVWDMKPSPDGRQVASTNMCSTGAVIIRDLASGDTTVLAEGWWYWGTTWSPDGRRLAVQRLPGVDMQRGPGAGDSGLRILDARTGADVTPDAVSGIPLAPSSWAGSYVTGVLDEDDGTKSTAVVSLGTGQVVRLATSVVFGTDYSSLSPDGRHVAFIDLVDGNQDVFVASVDGSGRRRVTSGPEPDRSPLWSPDGALLVYQNPNGMWALPMSGGAPTGAAYAVRGEPLYAPAAWTRTGIYHVVQNIATKAYQIPVDPETGRQTGPEEQLAVPVGDELWLAWSPDMIRMAIGGWDNEMRLYNRSQGSVTTFPMGAEFLPSNIWWSADGREVLFTTAARSRRDKGSTVFALNPADGKVRELFPRLDSVNHLHLSPDGRKMTFITHLGMQGPKELRVADIGRYDGVVLASAPGPDGPFSGRNGQPVFSPDGTMVLFQRGRGGPQDYQASIWVASADGSTPARAIATTNGTFFLRPVWGPDGKFIAVVDMDVRNRTGVLAVVSVETGERSEVLSFVNRREVDPAEVDLKYWSPDGRYLGITRSAGQYEYWVTTDVLGQSRGGGR